MSFFIMAFPLLLIIFIDGMGLGLVFPLINSLIVDPATAFLSGHSSEVTRSYLYGLVIGIFMLCWFFGAAILGDLSDSVGRKKSLMICILGSFGGYFLSSLAVIYKSLSLLIAGRILAGFTSGSQPIAQAAIVDLSSPTTKARNIGLVLMALYLGFVMGPLLGGILSDSSVVSWFTFSTPFTFVSILSLVNAVLLQLFFKETFFRKDKIRIKYLHSVRIFISAFTHRQIRSLSIIFLLFMLGWSSYYNYATLFVFERYGFNPLQMALFMACLGFGFVIGAGLFAQLALRWFSLKTIITTCFILISLLILVTLFSTEAITAWTTVIPIAAFALTAYSSYLTLFSNQVDEGSQGWVMGVSGAITALSFGITGLLGGWIVRYSADMPFILSLAFLLIAAFLLCRVKKIDENLFFHP